MSHEPLLSVRNLRVQFKTEEGAVDALNGVNFDVRRGEIIAVVGESGSGKSVTALSILNLLPPTAAVTGEIILQGDEVLNLISLSEDGLKKIRGNQISMIFQEPMTSLNPLLRCGEQVMEGLRLHQGLSKADARKKTLELFQQVELPEPGEMLQRYPHQLSGGQKQRVMIAMAISCGPSILIADEPTTALDVTVQKNILTLIRDLQAKLNMGVIFITHDLGLVSEVADQVVVMYKGNIVEQGSTARVMSNPVHPYTRALLACRPALHPRGSRLPTVSDFLDPEKTDHAPGTGQIHAPVKPGQLQEWIAPKPDTGTSPEIFPPASGTPILEVKDLNVYYPRRKNLLGKTTEVTKAVDGVSFEIREGETLGLVGESGCGKTTLGRAILRLIDIHAGQILYRGKDLGTMGKSELKPLRKEIQIIFQDPYSSLNPRISIGLAIREVLDVHRIGNNRKDQTEKTVHLLERVGLKPDHFNRYPHEFSGGQRQRIGIARALALDPAFMVCDESVSALDVSVQAQVLNLLGDLKKEYGFTTLFISHDLSVVHHVSDRIMVMNKGRIEEIGTASDIYYRPQSPYTRKLVEAIPGKPAFMG